MQPPQKNLEQLPVQEIEKSFGLSEKTKLEVSREIVSKTQPQAQPSKLVLSEGVGEPGIDISRTPMHQQVENILEQDLEEIYFSLDEKTQKTFKQKGEETAKDIMKLIQKAEATFKKVFKLIISWLKIIPAVNKFFIEQEAKIKADKILKIEE